MADVLPIDVPPEEAVRFFRAKGEELSFDWRDVYGSEHARVFTVAKAMHVDILDDIRAEVDRALADGTTLRDFRRDLEPTLQSKGWWGRQVMDDDGEPREVQLGSPRRLRTIYETNLRSAYAAGSWDRIERTRRARPYLRYVAIIDSATRDDHRRWHGTVLPADDPWWESHFPPNGWGCRCSVQQLSEHDLERFGYEVDDTAPSAPTSEWTNPRTGEVRRVPRGIDPGFDHNIGIAGEAHARSLLTQSIERVAEEAPDLASAAVRAGVDAPDFERFVNSPVGSYPVLIVPDVVRDAIGARTRVGAFSAESMIKNVGHHPELTVADYRLLARVGEGRRLIVQDSPRTAVIVTRGPASPTWTVVKTTVIGDEAFVTSFRYTNEQDIARLRRRGSKVLADELEG